MSGLSCTFTNTEMEYVALDADVEIIPRLEVEVVPCVTQTYGPFRPNVPVLVPLWLALILSQRGECTVKLGERFCSDYISSIRKQERDDASSFQSVPSLYLEKSRLLSKDVKLDMIEQSMLTSSMEDLLSLRQNKIRRAFRRQLKHVEVLKKGFTLPSETSSIELNLIRAFSQSSLDMFHSFVTQEH